MNTHKKYKILVISNYRGIHQCRPEAELFIMLHRLGHTITIMTHADADYIPRFEEAGIEVIPSHPLKRYDVESIRLIRAKIVQGKYDFLHLYNNKAITNGIRAAKGLPIKVIIYRGASANMHWYNPLNYLKFLHPRIDAAICNSEEIRKLFLKVPFYNKGKAVTILKGHDISWYDDVIPQDIRQELGIESKEILFVTVANNRKVKGIDCLLQAIELLPQHLRARFLIIGSKMEKYQQIDKWKSNPRIHFLGYRKDAINIVKACNVYILPSVGSEALTKSVIEAMSMQVPAVISDLAGNRPLIDDNVNGWIFKSEDSTMLSSKIQEIIENPNLITTMGIAAQQKIQNDIHIDSTLQGYLKLYAHLS